MRKNYSVPTNTSDLGNEGFVSVCSFACSVLTNDLQLPHLEPQNFHREDFLRTFR